MSEIPISRKDIGLQEPEVREGAVPALKDFVKSHESIIGRTPEQRAGWLTGLRPEELSTFLIDLNGTVRGITGNHIFDGEGVQAGTVGGSIPPDQEDKEPILHYALAEMQVKGQQMLAQGASYQDVLDNAAVVLPTIVNKLHLFGDGNGRTSRTLRMILRDGIENADAGIQAIVSKEGFNKYDTTPSIPIEQAIVRRLRTQHGTQDIQVDDDILQDDEFALVEDYLEALYTIPNLDPRIAKSWEDTAMFDITVKTFAKRHEFPHDQDDKIRISLKGLLDDLSENPDQQNEFLDIYRDIRKEKTILWTDSLTGKVEVPLTDHHRWLRAINYGRQDKSQANLDEQDINTAVKLQTAYVESQAPVRAS